VSSPGQPHSVHAIPRKPVAAQISNYGARRDRRNNVRNYPETLHVVTGNENTWEASPYQSTARGGPSPDISPIEPVDGQSPFAMTEYSQHWAGQGRPQLEIRTLAPDSSIRTGSLPSIRDTDDPKPPNSRVRSL